MLSALGGRGSLRGGPIWEPLSCKGRPCLSSASPSPASVTLTLPCSLSPQHPCGTWTGRAVPDAVCRCFPHSLECSFPTRPCDLFRCLLPSSLACQCLHLPTHSPPQVYLPLVGLLSDPWCSHPGAYVLMSQLCCRPPDAEPTTDSFTQTQNVLETEASRDSDRPLGVLTPTPPCLQFMLLSALGTFTLLLPFVVWTLT